MYRLGMWRVSVQGECMASICLVRGKWRALVRKGRDRGWPEVSKSFEKRADADRWARKLEAERDTSLRAMAGGQTTVGELIRMYREAMRRPLGKNKANVLKHLEGGLGKVRAADLTSSAVVHYLTKVRRVRGVTASIDLTYLKVILRFARTMWRIDCRPEVVDEVRDLLSHMGLLGRSMERDRRPSPDELARLRAWFAERSRTLTPDHLDFILASCFRPPSEVVGLRWADLNEADRTILIRDRKDPQKKIGNNQTVPLLNGSFDIVVRQPRTGEFIFPVNGKTWSTVFARACRSLGIKDLRLYDLRHEAISRLMGSGRFTIPEAMLVTGHKNPQQLMRYTQLQARDLHSRASRE